MKKFLVFLSVFALVFALAIPCFAASNADTLGIPNVYIESPIYGDNYHQFMYVARDGNGYRLVRLNSKPYIVREPGDIYELTWNYPSDGSWSYESWDLIDGTWDNHHDSPNSGSCALSEIVWVSEDVSYNGKVLMSHDKAFFGLSLSEAVNSSLTEDFTPKFVNTIKTLLVVGLVIMAVFVGVSLIPRILYKFL